MINFIKLTNNADGHKGMPLYINAGLISTVYEIAAVDGGSLKTCIYGGPTGVIWEVEESPKEVMNLIQLSVQHGNI